MADPTVRHAARVVLLDEHDNILLIRFHDRDRMRWWWATPGGSLGPSESYEAAARRELREETGLTDVTLGPWIWTREHTFSAHDRLIEQHERIFLARVARFVPVPTHLDELERDFVREMRWWSPSELRLSLDEFAPRELAELLDQLLRRGIPAEPLVVGV